MAQKYNIFINDKPLTLAHPDDNTAIRENSPTYIVSRYLGRVQIFKEYHDLLEKSPRMEGLLLLAPDVEKMFEGMCSTFKIVSAAGGIVQNDRNECFFIYRRGSWDLPKGKIDPGETPEIAAVREVLEETGIQANITAPAPVTYHTYRDRKNNRVLKPTHWFDMRTTQTDFKLQTEEDIEDALWLPIADFLASGRPMYHSLRNLLTDYLRL